MTSPPPPSPRLGDVLVAEKVITPEQLQRALTEQASWGGPLGQNLLTLGFIDEATLVRALADHLGLRTVDLDATAVSVSTTHLLPIAVAERYGLIPLALREDPKVLVVACGDPTNDDALRAARMATQLPLEVWVATPSAIERALRRWYYGETPAPGPVAATDPRFNTTRHNLEPVAPQQAGLEERVAELERRLEQLTLVVDRLSGGSR